MYVSFHLVVGILLTNCSQRVGVSAYLASPSLRRRCVSRQQGFVATVACKYKCIVNSPVDVCTLHYTTLQNALIAEVHGSLAVTVELVIE
jgi:hypothetical protein